MKLWICQLEILFYLGSEQQIRWSDCADAQADLRLYCSIWHKTGFSHDVAQFYFTVPRDMTKRSWFIVSFERLEETRIEAETIVSHFVVYTLHCVTYKIFCSICKLLFVCSIDSFKDLIFSNDILWSYIHTCTAMTLKGNYNRIINLVVHKCLQCQIGMCNWHKILLIIFENNQFTYRKNRWQSNQGNAIYDKSLTWNCVSQTVNVDLY